MSHSCLACTGDADCPLLVYFTSLQAEIDKLRRRNVILDGINATLENDVKHIKAEHARVSALLADVQCTGQQVVELKKEVNYWRAAYGPGPKYYDVSDDDDNSASGSDD